MIVLLVLQHLEIEVPRLFEQFAKKEIEKQNFSKSPTIRDHFPYIENLIDNETGIKRFNILFTNIVVFY